MDIYLVRHCHASGQGEHAPLTDEGLKQAEDLAHHFSNINIDQILSSPYQRTIQSLTPLANQRNMTITTDKRLVERVLSNKHFHDWKEKLAETFLDLDMRLEGGESSQQAMFRGIDVINDVLNMEIKTSVIATHGNLMALILKYFTPSIGFEDWQQLSNPDVYWLSFEKGNLVSFKRIWK